MASLYTSVEGIQCAMANFRTGASEAAGRSYQPDPTDVFIATYPKCGTTWVQQIVHSLRTNGDDDFDDICAVVPWLEMCLDLEQDPYQPQRAAPKAFKSHLHAHDIPKGGRYINVVRDPRAVLVSFYRFFEGWYFEPGSVHIDDFARSFYLTGSRSGRFWDHVVAWWNKRGSEDTLLLCYESMRDAPEAAVRRIAAFLGFGDDEDRIAVATEQSSFATMNANADKYDEKLLRRYRNGPCGVPPEAGSNKVGSGQSAQEVGAISPATLAAIDAAWLETVTPATGLDSYRHLRRVLDSSGT